MKTRSLMAVLSLLCLCVYASAQDKPDRFKEQLEPVIKQVMRQTSMPGFAVAIVENQKIVYSAGFGIKNLNGKEPVSARSLFHMASITKPFVELNVEAYPLSSNVYDSLAEAYMRDGDKALAIENYEKSLKLNPGNTNAVDTLKKLRAQ